MPRAFLSHSSKDKGLVGRVFHDLGAANAVYDEATFELGEQSAAEIYKALNTSDLFVLFVSRASVESRWVQGEIAAAQHKIFSGSIKKVLVFILDDTPPDKLPQWLRDHIYRRLGSPRLIAKAIRSTLLNLALDAGLEVQFFVNRDAELSDLKGALSRLTSETPDVLFLSGVDGIGRRSLAKRALGDTYPSLSKVPVEIHLAGSEGDVDFFKHLLSYSDYLSIGDLNSLVEEFSSADPGRRTALIVDQLSKLTSQRQFVVLHGHEAIQKDDGDFHLWLSQVIRNMPKREHPQLVVVSRRMIPQHLRSKYTNAYFVALQSLSTDYSADLLTLWLKELKVDATRQLLEDIVEQVSGHPKHIELSAKYVAEVGIARVNANRVEFNDVIRARATALIEHVPLSNEQERFLALFEDYQYLSAEDLITAIDDADPVIQKGLAYLQDHGILEKDGSYLRLAPYLITAVSRHKWSGNVAPFLEKAQAKFIDRVKTLETNDYVTISAVDQALLSALRSSTAVNNPLLNRALLPSHMLRVAREFYDAQQFEQAADLCNRALGKSHALTRDAQIEALRLQALALARRGKDEEFFACIGKLEAYPERVAKRNVAFLRGFKQRWDGKTDEAEKYYREAYSYGGDQNFHVLRELAQLLAAKGEFDEAEEYAKRAWKIAPTNAYVIDNYLEILIERRRDNLHGLSSDPEIRTLFLALQEWAKIEGRSFYELRMAHYYSILKKHDEATEWAGRAIKISPNLIPAYLARAKVRFAAQRFDDIEEDVKQMQKLLSGPSGAGDKRLTFEVQRLRAKLRIAKGEFDKARSILESSIELPTSVRKILRRDLALAIAHAGTQDMKLKEWANRVLSGH